MPELPEVEALAHHLREHALYRPVARVDVASMSAVKTFDPPVSALVGRVVTGAARYGKFLAVEFHDRADDPLHLITHLSRAGWLRWHDTACATPPKPGRGPLELRVHLDDVGGPGFDLTEAGTQKRLSVYLVRDPQEVPGIARLGPDALDALAATSSPRCSPGAASGSRRCSWSSRRSPASATPTATRSCTPRSSRPYAVSGRLRPEQVDELYAAMRSVLTDAVDRSVGPGRGQLKGEKRSGLRVHARTGLPCPVCGDTVREVSFANKLVPVLSRLPDRRQAARRPAAVAAGEVGTW